MPIPEYHFRFSGLNIVQGDDLTSRDRVFEVRETILRIARGFTEINPEVWQDIIPGDGMGYIVALENERQLERLQNELAELTMRWGIPKPSITLAAEGPGKHFCFFLIPEKANPKAGEEFRDALFDEDERLQIDEKMNSSFPNDLRREFVYGEWLPETSERDQPIKDDSIAYVVTWKSQATEGTLGKFIKDNILGKCDQLCIYLSVCGMMNLVFEDK